MTVDAIGTHSPTVFEAGLPPIAYEHAHNPEEAHRLIRQARLQGPIALGPHGPEVLSYELVRTVLRDPRFRIPKGLALETQGITSGRLWEKATKGLLSRDGADHNRLRRLVSKAFTPRSTARLTEHDRRGHHRAGRPANQPRGAATWSPTSHAGIRFRSSAGCSAHRAKTGNCSPTGPTTSSSSSPGTSPTTLRQSWLPMTDSTPTSTTWSPSGATTSPTT